MHASLSLRARALLGGIVWIAMAVGLSGYVLLSAFDDISEKAFLRKLTIQIEQMEGLVRSGALDEGIDEAALTTPFFQRGGGGRFWLVQPPEGPPLSSLSQPGEVGALLAPVTSPSGFSQLLGGIVAREDGIGQAHRTYAARMPDGLLVQVMATAVPHAAAGGMIGTWTLRVGEARATLTRDKLAFRRSLFGALIGLGASLALAGAAQTGMALRPLVALRAAFLTYRAGEARRIEGQYPSDLATLVDDLNELLDRNEEVIRRARRQAADLAHALKTPVAVIRNDLSAPGGGQQDASLRRQRMAESLARIEGLITRYTARARTAGAAPGALCAPAPVVEGLGRVMALVHRDAGLIFDPSIPEDLRVRVEAEDLEELLGNLIDNAHKWAVGVVRVRAADLMGTAQITVEDDGPGIPADARAHAMTVGARLDEGTPGTGLGLAICADIIEAYGGTMELGVSDLGGLAVTVRLPAPAAAIPRRRIARA